MKGIDLDLSSKKGKIFSILGLCFLLLVISVISRIIFAEGTTGTSTTTSGTLTTPHPPAAPTNLSLYETDTSTFIIFHWNDNSNNEDRFSIERKLSSGSVWGVLGQTAANTPYYRDTAVVAGVNYDYRVQACLLGVGCSEYGYLYGGSIPAQTLNTTSSGDSGSNTTTTTSSTGSGEGSTTTNSPSTTTTTTQSTTTITPPATETPTTTAPTTTTVSPPAAPTNLSLYSNSTNTTSLIIKWNDNSSNESAFNIERKYSTESTWSPLTHVGANIIYYADTALIVNVKYDYRVRACNTTAGCSGYASISGVSLPQSGGDNLTTTTPTTNTTTGESNTLATPPPTTAPISTQTTTTQTPPPAPSNLSRYNSGSSSTQTSIIIKWNDNSNNEDRFSIERKLSSGSVWGVLGQTAANNPYYNDTTVVAGTNYDYRVQACLLGTGCSLFTYLVEVHLEKITVTSPAAPSTTETTTNTSTPPPVYPTTTNTTTTTTTTSTEPIKTTTTTPPPATTPPPSGTTENTSINTETEKIETSGTKEDIEKPEDLSEDNFKDITDTVNTLSGPATTEVEHEGEKVDLLYKDTNNDGVSDYDSIYVYKIDPVKPSPITNYQGRDVNAGEKILLGLDPAKEEVVKLTAEEPVVSPAPVIPTYKVENVELSTEKEVVFKGTALPNSYITIYIYSTPIIVTVKTDSNGEWQYTLDKELPDGDHTVYTATVNNSGNIVAKSPGYSFTKTAEAVTFRDIPITGATAESNKPGLWQGKDIFAIIMAIAGIIVAILIIIGMTSKKNKDVGTV